MKCLVDVYDILIYVNFFDDQLKGFGAVVGQISSFPIDFDRRPYITRVL